jgi:hypothetical protein
LNTEVTRLINCHYNKIAKNVNTRYICLKYIYFDIQILTVTSECIVIKILEMSYVESQFYTPENGQSSRSEYFQISHSVFRILTRYLLSRNNQHYELICTTALFYMLAPTCFCSSLPSTGSFWIRLSYVKIQIDMVVYHIMWLSGLCVGKSWFSLLCCPAECTQVGSTTDGATTLWHTGHLINIL